MFNIDCPYCKETLESIPDSMRGQQVQCPRCQRWLTVSAFKKQDIAKPSTLKTQPQMALAVSLEGKKKVQTNVKQTASIGAFVCLTLAIILICLSAWSLHTVWALALFYGPLLFAAFILSIVAMAQGRIAGGVILLLLTIIVPPMVIVIVAGITDIVDEVAEIKTKAKNEIATNEIAANEIAANEITQNDEIATDDTTQDNAEKAAYFGKLELRNIKIAKTYSDNYGIWGEVKNHGDQTLSKVEIIVYCKNDSGDTVYEETFRPVLYLPDSRWSSSVGKPLKPNYSEKFGYSLEDAPSDWSGAISVHIIDIEFAD